jgi:hypothetical protein
MASYSSSPSPSSSSSSSAAAASLSRQNALNRTPTKILYTSLERTNDKLIQSTRMVVEAAALAHTAKNELESQTQQRNFTTAVREIKATLQQALAFANECQKRINATSTYASESSKSGLVLQQFRKVRIDQLSSSISRYNYPMLCFALLCTVPSLN